MTPMKAIRAKCLDCCCGQSNEVRLCPISDCSLWPYRDGHNPARKGLGNKNASFLPNSAHDFEASAEVAT
jgi:hypothetical protein